MPQPPRRASPALPDMNHFSAGLLPTFIWTSADLQPDFLLGVGHQSPLGTSLVGGGSDLEATLAALVLPLCLQPSGKGWGG